MSPSFAWTLDRVKCVEFVARDLRTDLVLSQQRGELLSTHECDWCGVGTLCFTLPSAAETAGRDDEPLFVRSQRAAHLLDHGLLDVRLPV